jgi:O-antigen/teichoic acid export membrane protein
VVREPDSYSSNNEPAPMHRRLFKYLHTSPLAVTASGSLVLRIVGAGLGFLSAVVLARWLGPRDFGLYTLVMAAVSLAATVAALGLPSLLVREVARYGEHKQWNLLRGLVGTAHRWAALVVVAIVVLGFAAWVAVPALASLPVALIVAGLGIVPVMTFNQLRASILRGLHWVILSDIPDFFVRPLVMLCLVGGVYFSTRAANPSLAIGLQLAAALCAFVVGTVLLYRKSPSSVRIVRPDVERRQWLSETKSFFAITLLTLLEGQVAVYSLGYIGGTHSVGLFQAAYQFVMPVSLGLVAVNQPLLPKLAAAWARDDRATAQILIGEAAKLGAVVGLAAAAVLIPFAGLVSLIYGGQYHASGDILRVLVIGQLVNTLSGPCGVVLSATGRQRVVLLAVTIALGVNIVANAVLDPLYGGIGAATAVALSLLTWNGLMVYYAFRLTNLRTSIAQVLLTQGRS